MADKTFQAQILTPEGALFEGAVEGVKVPGTQGNFEMLVNHAPIISLLSPGNVVVKQPAGEEITYQISGGFVEMNNNRMTLLAESAVILENA
jgi:F-type H+-transporting ATPase subunit epsilon